MYSIEQFRHIVKDIVNKSSFVGKDENGESIFDFSCPKPIINFDLTVKIHGTNAGVKLNKNDELELFSKNRKLPLSHGEHFGFVGFILELQNSWKKFLKKLREELNCSELIVYGEFAGEGIQKKVGISKVWKQFYLFSVKNLDTNEVFPIWNFKTKVEEFLPNVYSIDKFYKETITVDFNEPEKAKAKIDEIVNKIEKRCPVASYFLPKEENLIGEGIVAVASEPFKGKIYMFKVKGEEHSKPLKKVKQKKSKLTENDKKLVELMFNPQRANQALTEIFGVDFEKNIDIRRMKEYIQWIKNDLEKEEYDRLTDCENREKCFNQVLNMYIEYFKKLWNNLYVVL